MHTPDGKTCMRNTNNATHAFMLGVECWMMKKASYKDSYLFFANSQVDQTVDRMTSLAIIEIIIPREKR
jgi:hypothetical protein